MNLCTRYFLSEYEVLMRVLPAFILGIAVIGALLLAGCIDSSSPTPNPNISATELRVHYDAPVHADYGTGDCYYQKDIPGQTSIPFSSLNCHMNHASFGKTINDTGTGVLRADLVRDGQVIKTYSTETSGVSFTKIDEFLVRSVQEPGLVQDTPITAKITTDGAWDGQLYDKYGSQNEHRSGSANLTLYQPVLPVEACVSTSLPSASASLVVELYSGEKLVKRSDARDTNGENCVTFP